MTNKFKFKDIVQVNGEGEWQIIGKHPSKPSLYLIGHIGSFNGRYEKEEILTKIGD